MDPLLPPNTFAAARKYRVRLQLLKMRQALQYAYPAPLWCPCTCSPQRLCVLCHCIKGPQDDVAFGLFGPDADKMRSGADLAASCGPWLMLQDLLGVPMDLPDIPVVVGCW